MEWSISKMIKCERSDSNSKALKTPEKTICTIHIRTRGHEKPPKTICVMFLVWSISILKVTVVGWSISKMIGHENGHHIRTRAHEKPPKKQFVMFLVHFNFKGYCSGAVHFQLGNDRMREWSPDSNSVPSEMAKNDLHHVSGPFQF